MHDRPLVATPLAGSALALLLLVVLIGIVVRLGWVQGADAQLMALVRGAGGDRLRPAVIGLTMLGSALLLLPLLVCAMLWLIATGARRQAWRLALVALTGRMAVELMKDAFVRVRPAVADMAVAVHSWSFPSAHAANSAITYGALALLGAAGGGRSVGVALAALLAVAIGCSRVWLGVHWPSDVIAGWLFAIGWLMLWRSVPPRSGAGHAGGDR